MTASFSASSVWLWMTMASSADSYAGRKIKEQVPVNVPHVDPLAALGCD